MPSRTATMFVNPTSGARDGAESAALREAAEREGVEVVEISNQLDISSTIRTRLSQGVRVFIAAGGDGTINHVLQPLVRADAVLGVIPAGTYNHFARDLGIPLDWSAALDVALRGRTVPVDVARVNDRYFANNISIGLYPEVVARREARGRSYPRWRARSSAILETLRHYPHVNLVLESEHHHEVVRTHVLMVSNNSYDLSQIGMEASRPTLSEGRLSVYWLPHAPRIALLRFAARYVAGRAAKGGGFRFFRTTRMRVVAQNREIEIGLDGEVFRLETPLVVTSVPQSLQVRVPHEDRQADAR